MVLVVMLMMRVVPVLVVGIVTMLVVMVVLMIVIVIVRVRWTVRVGMQVFRGAHVVVRVWRVVWASHRAWLVKR